MDGVYGVRGAPEACREPGLPEVEALAWMSWATGDENHMNASAWSSGGGTFGIRVGVRNRDRFFSPSWGQIEVELDGEPHTFTLTPGFWRSCPEFRDSGARAIRNWLQRHHTLSWPAGEPPRFQLLPLGGRRFRVVA